MLSQVGRINDTINSVVVMNIERAQRGAEERTRVVLVWDHQAIMSDKSDKGKKRDKRKGAESGRVALCPLCLVGALIAGAEIYAESVCSISTSVHLKTAKLPLKLPKLKTEKPNQI